MYTHTITGHHCIIIVNIFIIIIIIIIMIIIVIINNIIINIIINIIVIMIIFIISELFCSNRKAHVAKFDNIQVHSVSLFRKNYT